MEDGFLSNENIKMRRRPQQKRAVATVERIMATALDLILKEGFASITTNHIARAAEVEISSLYQYFPNKHTIVLAIYEKAVAEFAAVTHGYFIAEMGMPLDEGLRRIMKKVFDYIEKHQDVLVRLVNEVPHLRQTTMQAAMNDMTYQTTYLYLRQQLPQENEATVRFRMYCSQHTSLSLIYQYLQNKPAGISRKRFLDGLTRICLSILREG